LDFLEASQHGSVAEKMILAGAQAGPEAGFIE
jgi:hypothetical protein